MSAHLDMGASRRPGLEIQRVKVDFPVWMIEALDYEAGRLGVSRQSVIGFWVSECLTGEGMKGAVQSPEPAPKNVARSAGRTVRHT